MKKKDSVQHSMEKRARREFGKYRCRCFGWLALTSSIFFLIIGQDVQKNGHTILPMIIIAAIGSLIYGYTE